MSYVVKKVGAKYYICTVCSNEGVVDVVPGMYIVQPKTIGIGTVLVEHMYT